MYYTNQFFLNTDIGEIRIFPHNEKAGIYIEFKLYGERIYKSIGCDIVVDLKICNTESKGLSDRNEFIDIVKGLAIFLMLWGHCIQYCCPVKGGFYSDLVFKVIYSFHMPLLMAISGYLFYVSAQKYSKGKLFENKTTALIKSIIGGNIFQWIFTTALFAIIQNHRITIFIDGKWLEMMPSLWFLWSVLSATIVMCLVEKYAKQWYHHLLFIFGGIIFVMFFPNWQMNLYMYPYFVIGYYYSRYKNTINKANWMKYGSIVLFPVMLCFFKKEHYIYTSGILGGYYSTGEYLVIDIYRWAIGLVGSIFAITVVELLCKVKRQEEFLKKAIAPLGKKSLQIYVLSVVFLSSYLPKAMEFVKETSEIVCIYNAVSQNSIVYDFIFTLVITIIYAVTLYWFAKLLEKIKVSKLIFGRNS